MTVVPGKRGFDLMIAGAALVALVPALLLVAAVIRLDDGGPVLFRQERVGHRGRRFVILKFRTMRRSAGGPQITVGSDARITRCGAWLRRTKLDELPQLINIMRGDMSLVGLRPEVPRYVEAYPRRLRPILQRRPGLTDPASIRLRAEGDLLARVDDPECFYRDVLVPVKVRTSLGFARRETLTADWAVLWRTVRPGRAA